MGDDKVANVRIQGRCAALSRSVPWNDGFGILCIGINGSICFDVLNEFASC